jgi:hypothetical protein
MLCHVTSNYKFAKLTGWPYALINSWISARQTGQRGCSLEQTVAAHSKHVSMWPHGTMTALTVFSGFRQTTQVGLWFEGWSPKLAFGSSSSLSVSSLSESLSIEIVVKLDP